MIQAGRFVEFLAFQTETEFFQQSFRCGVFRMMTSQQYFRTKCFKCIGDDGPGRLFRISLMPVRRPQMKSQFIIMFVMFPETAASDQFMILQIEQRPVLNAEVLLIDDFGLQPVLISSSLNVPFREMNRVTCESPHSRRA